MQLHSLGPKRDGIEPLVANNGPNKSGCQRRSVVLSVIINFKFWLHYLRRQRSDADGCDLTTAIFNNAPVASCCHAVISVVIFIAVILLFGLVHVKDHLGCGRTLWAAFEEIFRPHISLRHTMEPPV